MALIFRAYCLDPEIQYSLTGIRFKKRHMTCIKRIWDYTAWDLGLAEEPLLERNEESLEETNSTDVSSEDEGIQDDDDDDEDEGDQGDEWGEEDEWDQGEGQGEADTEEDETEANENEVEDSLLGRGQNMMSLGVKFLNSWSSYSSSTSCL
jgi:hypothetical protein